MTKSKLFHNILIVIIPIVLWNCASQSQPTGGPKDKEPPKLISSIPEDQSLNYREKLIELEFDEHIAVSKIKTELIITPRIDAEYDFKLRKDKLILEFEENFKDSTTYTFNFRKSIKDITEGNFADALLSFSTGPFLDTGSIRGNIINLITKQPMNNAVIGLYDDEDTLDLFTGMPLYFTKSNKKGDFIFRNVKNGNYYLYAFTDKNSNLICESKNEIYGFHNELIRLDSTISGIKLSLFHLNLSDFKIQSSRQNGKYFEIKFNKYVTDYKVEPLDSTINIIHHLVDQNKTLKIYDTFNIQDSLALHITATDSLNTIVTDTIYVKYQETARNLDDFTFKIRDLIYDKSTSILSSVIDFSKPVKSITQDSIYIRVDSLNSIHTDTAALFSFNDFKTSLVFEKEIPNTIIDSLKLKNMVFAFGSFVSIENDSSLNTVQKFTINTPESSGIIHISIETELESFTVELLSNKFVVIKTEKNIRNFSFMNVKPGEYKIRVFFDENNNGKWDAGNFYEKIQPEKVVIFTDPVEKTNKIAVRANWELGPYIIQQ